MGRYECISNEEIFKLSYLMAPLMLVLLVTETELFIFSFTSKEGLQRGKRNKQKLLDKKAANTIPL